MGKRDEALALLRQGLTPSQIRKRQGVTLSTILAYLDELVGGGRLRRSDIFFSIPSETRRAVFSHFADLDPSQWNSVGAECYRMKDRGIDVERDDVEVVARYRDERFALGDMYEDVRSIEVELHSLVKKSLQDKYGTSEDGWWREGVPLNIRQKCVSRREEDDEPLSDPFRYSDIVDLRSIVEKQWSVIAERLPGQAASDKKRLSADLVKLNQIRKLVMHPVRGGIPSEEDFEFLRSLRTRLGFGMGN